MKNEGIYLQYIGLPLSSIVLQIEGHEVYFLFDFTNFCIRGTGTGKHSKEPGVLGLRVVVVGSEDYSRKLYHRAY